MLLARQGLPMLQSILSGKSGGKKGGLVSSLLGPLMGGGGDGDEDQQGEQAAQRHQQIMTMLAMGGQRQGLGGQFMMRQLMKQTRRLMKLEHKFKQRWRNRRRRKKEMMMLRHEPYWSAPPPRRPFKHPANKTYRIGKYV